MGSRKIWLVEFPTYQYTEDVKSLAARASLKIIDAKRGKAISSEFIEQNPPKLTLKNAKSKKVKKEPQ